MAERRAVTLVIPDEVTFDQLQLSRSHATGDLEFSWEPIESICEASGLPLSTFTESPEDNTASLISALYQQHLQAGGDPHPVMVDLLGEIAAEDTFGGGLSHAPGRA